MSLSIKAERRDVFGKNASRRIRRQGNVPAILYGTGSAGSSLTLAKKDVFAILKSETRENTLFKILVDGESQDAMIKELQRDPTSDELLHLDLIHIALDRAIRISVPILLVGDAVGVKTEGGFVDFLNREVEIECLPAFIPEHIPVNIEHLHLHQSVKVEEVTPPEGVKFISDQGTVLVLISAPHVEEVAAKPEVEEGIAEEKEPEVIKKERTEKEEKE